MPDVGRIDVKEARRRVASARAMLVCGYDDEAKCHRLGLEGSIDLEARGEQTAVRIAASLQPKGMLRFAESMIRGVVERELPSALEKLREHLESKA